MRFRDGVRAALVSMIWGFGVVVIKLGLSSFAAPQLIALRFIVAAPPVFLAPRPTIVGATFIADFLISLHAHINCCANGFARWMGE